MLGAGRRGGLTEHGRKFASVWEEGRHAFTDVLTQYGLAHHRIPAYSPEANGK